MAHSRPQRQNCHRFRANGIPVFCLGAFLLHFDSCSLAIYTQSRVIARDLCFLVIVIKVVAHVLSEDPVDMARDYWTSLEGIVLTPWHTFFQRLMFAGRYRGRMKRPSDVFFSDRPDFLWIRPTPRKKLKVFPRSQLLLHGCFRPSQILFSIHMFTPSIESKI